MSGINMYGIFQKDHKKVHYLENGVEKISQLPQKKWNFKKMITRPAPDDDMGMDRW